MQSVARAYNLGLLENNPQLIHDWLEYVDWQTMFAMACSLTKRITALKKKKYKQRRKNLKKAFNVLDKIIKKLSYRTKSDYLSVNF